MANEITCPKCGAKIDIEHLIQENTKAALDKEIEAQKAEFEEQLKKVKQDTEKLKVQKEKEKEQAIEDALNEQKKEFKQKEEKIREKVLEEQKEAYETLQEELNEKSEQLKNFNKLQADYLRLEREKKEQEEKIKAKAEEEYGIKLAEQKQQLKQAAEEEYELRIKELEKKLKDQIELTEEMKKRQEQGSMQLQGEVQELAIEEYLRQNFIFDDVQEVGKGDMGADSLLIVKSEFQQVCGTIYFESKRTKTFKEDWIPKFKNDIQEKGADIGVLVTAIYPKDMTRMGVYKGIYICTYEEFKALSFILRENIIRLSEVKEQQVNKYDKSILLYNYLTSNEFQLQMETIVNAFVTMQNDLEAEKRAMNKIWKKREKEITNVISATNDMRGSIKGIAGNAIKEIRQYDTPLLEVLDE